MNNSTNQGINHNTLSKRNFPKNLILNLAFDRLLYITPWKKDQFRINSTQKAIAAKSINITNPFNSEVIEDIYSSVLKAILVRSTVFT
jgi:hypothetical protein